MPIITHFLSIKSAQSSKQPVYLCTESRLLNDPFLAAINQLSTISS